MIDFLKTHFRVCFGPDPQVGQIWEFDENDNPFGGQHRARVLETRRNWVRFEYLSWHDHKWISLPGSRTAPFRFFRLCYKPLPGEIERLPMPELATVLTYEDLSSYIDRIKYDMNGGMIEGEFTQEELDSLLSFISGPGILPGGIYTYPQGNDDDRRIYAACCMLEQQGKAQRLVNTSPVPSDNPVVYFVVSEKGAE